MTNNNLRKFPLYDTLVAKLSQRVNQENYSVTPEYKSRLSTILSNLDPARGTEISLLLIHYYFLTTPDSNPFTLSNCTVKSSARSSVNNLPYNIRISPPGTGYSFDIDTLPIPFQALLGIYCCI
jgi:hypothetical protein